MRLILLSFIFLTALTTSYAQYSPMLEEGSEWYSFYQSIGASCNGVTRVQGDSLINGVNYKQLVTSASQEGLSCVEDLNLMREDTITQKVFLWRGNDTEIVVYDYGLEEGDTLFYDPSFSSYLLILDSITFNIPYNNSCAENMYPITTLENPKVFHFQATNPSERKVLWVEGIGNLADPVISNRFWQPGNMTEQVLCHYNTDGIRDYQDLSDFCDDPTDCLGLVLSTRDIISSSGLNVFPNPATDEVRIETINSEVGELSQVSFFDAQGQFLNKQTIDSEGAVRINELKSGLIFGIVETKSGVFLSLKFVKH